MSSGNRSLFDAGLQTRREVVGNVYVDRSLENGSTEFTYPNQQLVTEYDEPLCHESVTEPSDQYDVILDGVGATFGLVLAWNANNGAYLGMLIALKSWPELGVHVRGSINNGLSELEIREAILQASIYCGVPAGIEATKVANKTLDNMVASGEYKRILAGKSADA